MHARKPSISTGDAEAPIGHKERPLTMLHTAPKWRQNPQETDTWHFKEQALPCKTSNLEWTWPQALKHCRQKYKGQSKLQTGCNFHMCCTPKMLMILRQTKFTSFHLLLKSWNPKSVRFTHRPSFHYTNARAVSKNARAAAGTKLPEGSYQLQQQQANLFTIAAQGAPPSLFAANPQETLTLQAQINIKHSGPMP
jgi:hypothetical protein